MGLKESLKTAIFPLYEDLAKIEQEKSYTTFCVQWGEKYQPGGMLFVGRATYGWAVDDRDTERLFTDGCESQVFARPDQMKWVESYWKKSAFWRVIRNVTQGVIGPQPDWYEHIAWDNLYKLSPDGSNPSNALCGEQENLCFELFKQELAVLRPKVVILLTGKSWYYDFLCSVNNDTAPAVLGEKNWSRYRAVVYKIGDVVFIGTEHPQGKAEAEHAAALTELAKKYM